MTNAWLEKEEHPNDNDSHLFDDCASGSSAELCDACATPIEHGASKNEADAIREQHRLRLELLCGYEDIICMVVDTLGFVEWAREQLGGDQKHYGEDHSEDAFPTHHIERLLTTRSLKDELLKYSL